MNLSLKSVALSVAAILMSTVSINAADCDGGIAVSPEVETCQRTINMIIVHCSATPGDRHVSVAEIDAWHRQRGFDCIGYHYVIDLDGIIYRGRDINKIGAHCKGYNTNSIGVCYVGGVDSNMMPCDTRTLKQRLALTVLLIQLQHRFPGAQIRSHRDFAAKDCPSFDATEEYRNMEGSL